MLTLTLVTPQKRLLVNQEIEEIFVPGELGEMNILPGHAPLLSTLAVGPLKYRLKGSNEVKVVAISWGFVEVNADLVNILAETAETPEQIDVERAKDAYKRSVERLNMAGLGGNEMEKLQRKQERAKLRVEIANQ
jgi:F-type H+-transporting ATPase subunit epsilon